MPKHAVTLLELLIALILVAMMAVGFSSIDRFSRHHVITADYQAKLQNELAYTMQHIAKRVQVGIGDNANPPLFYYPNSAAPTGFSVRVDASNTPANLNDDQIWRYFRNGNNFEVLSCVGGVCSPSEVLISGHLVNNSVKGIMPSSGALSGLYLLLEPASRDTVINVGLVVRQRPLEDVSATNPQVSYRTTLRASSAPAH